MARFQLAVRTSNVTSGQAALEVIAGGKACTIKAFSLSLVTAVVGVFGVGRPAAAGITPATPVRLLPTGAAVGDSSQAAVALAWATPPTAPTQYFKRASMAGVIGSLWPNFEPHMPAPQGTVGWFVPAQTSLVLFNILGGPTLDVDIEIDE